MEKNTKNSRKILAKVNKVTQEHKDQIIAFIYKNNRSPSQSSNFANERRMASRLFTLTCPNVGSYDPVFTKKVIKAGFIPTSKRAEISKNDILEFCSANNRVPSYQSKDPDEVKLHTAYRRIAQMKESKKFDPEFRKRLIELGYLKPSHPNAHNKSGKSVVTQTRVQNAQKIISFYNANGYLPSKASPDAYERLLGRLMTNMAAPSGRCHYPQFAKKARELGYGSRKRKPSVSRIKASDVIKESEAGNND